eukprot:3273678-Alexandrium_andersonii.AAC.1
MALHIDGTRVDRGGHHKVRNVAVGRARGLAVHRKAIVGPLFPERPFDNVVTAPGLSWASMRMKAQGVQCRATFGAR